MDSLRFTKNEAVALLTKYYPTGFKLSEVSVAVDMGDGSSAPYFDIIDIKNSKLHRVKDYFSDDPAYCRSEMGELEDEFYHSYDDGYRDTLYSEACSRDYGDNPSSIGIDDLIDIILKGIGEVDNG